MNIGSALTNEHLGLEEKYTIILLLCAMGFSYRDSYSLVEMSVCITLVSRVQYQALLLSTDERTSTN
jgi:hypothetical protein